MFLQGGTGSLEFPNHKGGDQDAKHRAGCVSSAVQPKSEPTLLGFDVISDQGITRRCAHTLADAVRPSDCANRLPGGCNVKERLSHGGDAIANNRQPLAAAKFIGQPARENLQHAGSCFCDALDNTDNIGLNAQD